MMRMSRVAHYTKLAIGVTTLSSLLWGCSGVPEKDTILKDARSSFSAAKSDTNVSTYAQTALYDAEKALKQAENADTSVQMQHLAYLAQRQAEIAHAIGVRRAAEVERDTLSKQQGEVVLMSRERELNQKSQQIDQKAREAQLAQEQAERARLQAQEAQAKAEQLLAQNRELQDQLKELQGKQTDKGLVLTLGDVLFETAKAELLPSATHNLNKIAEFLTQYPNRNVLIEGHTDDRGGDAYNQGLSEQRAESVRMSLIQRGISPQRIITHGYGKARPIESNASEMGRQKNRRVEITILNEGERW
jgi:OmpA-OmpF porin, OOP family